MNRYTIIFDNKLSQHDIWWINIIDILFCLRAFAWWLCIVFLFSLSALMKHNFFGDASFILPIKKYSGWQRNFFYKLILNYLWCSWKYFLKNAIQSHKKGHAYTRSENMIFFKESIDLYPKMRSMWFTNIFHIYVMECIVIS